MIARLWLLPVGILLASYAWLGWDHGTAWVLPVVVHENGRYTLAETIAYWRHFLRELPVAGLYALSVVAAVRGYGPASRRGPAPWVRVLAAVGAGALVCAAGVATSVQWGSDVAVHELQQSFLHDDDVPMPGIHWGYHVLSSIAFLGGAIVTATMARIAVDGSAGPVRPAARRRWGLAVAVAFAGVSLACGVPAATFVAPRFLGHQAREAVTHLAMTLPIAWAVLERAGGWGAANHQTAGGLRALVGDVPRDVWCAGAVTVALGGFLALGAVVGGATHEAAATVPLSSLVAAHVFEHVLDYVFVALVVLALAPGASIRHARTA